MVGVGVRPEIDRQRMGMARCGQGKDGGADHPRRAHLIRPELLGQFQPLSLIVRGNTGTIQRFGPLGHTLVNQPPDDLAVLQDEGCLVAAHFQHPATARAPGGGMAETGIEEPGVMNAEFTRAIAQKGNFGGVIGEIVTASRETGICRRRRDQG